MVNFKAMFFVESIEAFTGCLNALQEIYPDICVVSDLVTLNAELSDVKPTGLAVVFAERALLEQVPAALLLPSEPGNRLWIALEDKPSEIPNTMIHSYDVIDCSNALETRRFLEILRRDIACQIRQRSLESELKELYNIGKVFSAEKDTRTLLEKIVDACMELTSSDGGSIFLVKDGDDEKWSTYQGGEAGGKRLTLVTAKNDGIDADIEALTLPISRESIAGYTVLTGQPVRIGDAYNIHSSLDYRFNRHFDEITGYRTRSILSVPMKDHNNRVLGVIQLTNKRHGEEIIPFESRDEMIIFSLAGQAAVALENSLLYSDMEVLLEQYRHQNEKLHRLSERILRAHEEERKRIARDIHDGPAQSMSGCSLKIEILKKCLQRNMLHELSTALDELNDQVILTAKDMRRIIYDLKPSSLEAGLFQALENHFSFFKQETGIKVLFAHSGGDSGLEYYLTSTLYRIIIEACTNINKHAEAKLVEVGLGIEPDSIKLSVADDGKGFDPQSIDKSMKQRLKGGFGLEGMRERVELVLGTLVIDSAPGKGTRLTVTIPRA
ncbi:MAG: GAF domain-containing sensor histidine kinase [Bacillota bacterium]